MEEETRKKSKLKREKGRRKEREVEGDKLRKRNKKEESKLLIKSKLVMRKQSQEQSEISEVRGQRKIVPGLVRALTFTSVSLSKY